ncbi:MAG TPA: hypothetical protein PK129_12690, partial [Cellvibrionaceae bacterium]|nr:hypothetical protein [Cellvibrionaceae bacterium]
NGRANYTYQAFSDETIYFTGSELVRTVSNPPLNIRIGMSEACPPDSVIQGYWEGTNLVRICNGGYKGLKLKPIEPLSCSGPQAVGNPITLAAGEKIQPEIIDFEGLPVSFHYRSQLGSALPGSSSGRWQQLPEKISRRDKMEITAKTSVYLTASDACLTGLQELKDKAPANDWIRGVVAEYSDSCKSCLLKKNGTLVSALAIVDNESLGVGNTGLDVAQHQHESGAITYYYRVCGTNQFKPFSANVQEMLLLDANDFFNVVDKNGIKKFDGAGQLSSVYNLSGVLQRSYQYNDLGELNSVVDSKLGRYEYGSNNNLLNFIQSPSGKRLTFSYSGSLLTQVILPDQKVRTYHYEDPRFSSALTGITDERGVRFATWKYDDKGRAISSEHAGGADKTTLAFNADGSTTVTNALGKKTTYSFTDILGVRRVTNVSGEPTASCVGANQAYTYTPQGQVETKTDWNGTVTRFTYDSFGRELTKTQAYGTTDAKTIQTCWNANSNQPSRVIEPTTITLFDYTATGQLKSKTQIPRPTGTVDCLTAL